MLCAMVCREGVCSLAKSCPQKFVSPACGLNRASKYGTVGQALAPVRDLEDLVTGPTKRPGGPKVRRPSRRCTATITAAAATATAPCAVEMHSVIAAVVAQTSTERLVERSPPPPLKANADGSVRGVFYKKPIVNSCTPLNSSAGKRFFRAALQQGNLEGSWWSLMENFGTQVEPSSCGLGSLSMVLNSMGIDPGQRSTMGPWRWWTEESLSARRGDDDLGGDGDGAPELGITLQGLARLARENGAQTVERDGGNSFRRDLATVCGSEDIGRRMVASFSRRVLGQTGDGHHSPIGAYDEVSDQVLVLDVARFKYAPWWVPVPLMEKALSTVDPASGRQRGYLLLEPCPKWRPEGVETAMASPAA